MSSFFLSLYLFLSAPIVRSNSLSLSLSLSIGVNVSNGVMNFEWREKRKKYKHDLPVQHMHIDFAKTCNHEIEICWCWRNDTTNIAWAEPSVCAWRIMEFSLDALPYWIHLLKLWFPIADLFMWKLTDFTLFYIIFLANFCAISWVNRINDNRNLVWLLQKAAFCVLNDFHFYFHFSTLDPL